MWNAYACLPELLLWLKYRHSKWQLSTQFSLMSRNNLVALNALSKSFVPHSSQQLLSSTESRIPSPSFWKTHDVGVHTSCQDCISTHFTLLIFGRLAHQLLTLLQLFPCPVTSTWKIEPVPGLRVPDLLNPNSRQSLVLPLSLWLQDLNLIMTSSLPWLPLWKQFKLETTWWLCTGPLVSLTLPSHHWWWNHSDLPLENAPFKPEYCRLQSPV